MNQTATLHLTLTHLNEHGVIITVVDYSLSDGHSY